MGKTRADGQRTRQKVLDEAVPLFARHGYAGTSIRMISGAAGVNVATLAYHFGDKDGLYNEVLTVAHEKLALAFPMDSLQGAPDDVLGQVVRRGWQFCKEHRLNHQLLTRHLLDQGGLPEVVVTQWSDLLIERGVSVVRLFRPEWSVVEARLLVMTLQHLLVRLSIQGEGDLRRMLVGPNAHDFDLDAAVTQYAERLIRRQLGLPVDPVSDSG